MTSNLVPGTFPASFTSKTGLYVETLLRNFPPYVSEDISDRKSLSLSKAKPGAKSH